MTIATSEPLDVAWVEEILAHTRKTIQLVVANPLDLQRYRTEFYTLARSVKDAKQEDRRFGQRTTSSSWWSWASANRQLDANDQGIIQVVDWLWQYAFDQRASTSTWSPGARWAPSAFASTACCTPSTRCPWR
jgi:general secretion pathway protein E